MSKINYIGELSHESIDYFRTSIKGSLSQSDFPSLSLGSHMMEILVPRKLKGFPQYFPHLESELARYGYELDGIGHAMPVLCRNVDPHIDHIGGSHLSVIANVSDQVGTLLIHDQDKRIIEYTRLEKGKIFTFNHYEDTHSTQYNDDPQGYMMIARGSVIKK